MRSDLHRIAAGQISTFPAIYGVSKCQRFNWKVRIKFMTLEIGALQSRGDSRLAVDTQYMKGASIKKIYSTRIEIKIHKHSIFAFFSLQCFIIIYRWYNINIWKCRYFLVANHSLTFFGCIFHYLFLHRAVIPVTFIWNKTTATHAFRDARSAPVRGRQLIRNTHRSLLTIIRDLIPVITELILYATIMKELN